jgi:aminoglycoside 3-N-acetyltransferase I
MDYKYKQLALPDVNFLKDLLKVFGEAFSETEVYQNAIPSEEYLKSLLSKSHFIALVALRSGSVVGGLTAYELEKFEQERKELYIYDLAVSEEHRRKGIATKLIQELKAIAKARKAYVIYVQADKDDKAAIQLYESLGTKEDVLHYDIPVESE